MLLDTFMHGSIITFVIISKNYAFTSTHCMTRQSPKQIKVLIHVYFTHEIIINCVDRDHQLVWSKMWIWDAIVRNYLHLGCGHECVFVCISCIVLWGVFFCCWGVTWGLTSLPPQCRDTYICVSSCLLRIKLGRLRLWLVSEV